MVRYIFLFEQSSAKIRNIGVSGMSTGNRLRFRTTLDHGKWVVWVLNWFFCQMGFSWIGMPRARKFSIDFGTIALGIEAIQSGVRVVWLMVWFRCVVD